MNYLICYLCIVYTLHRRVTGSSFKASNQEIDTFINQLLASQRFDELADKVAEKALRRLTENDTSLIKNVATVGKRFTYEQRFRSEEKRRDKDMADFASKETEHIEVKNEKLPSINLKSTKYGTQSENLKLSYNTLKKQAQEKALTNHNSGSYENKPKWVKIEISDENNDNKKASEESERDISENHNKNIYEKNRDRFDREFNQNIDQIKHSKEFEPDNSKFHNENTNSDRFGEGTHENMNQKEGSKELFEQDNISKNQKKNAYEKSRDRFNNEFHDNTDLRKHSDEIEHDNISEHHEKSYNRNRDRFGRGKIHENTKNRPSNSDSHKKNIYEENRDRFERGQAGINIAFSNENEDRFERNNIQKYTENDVKVHFKSESNEKPTSPHIGQEKQSHLTLIDVENVPINRDYKMANGDAYKINLDKDAGRASYVEVPHKMHSHETALKDDRKNEEQLNFEEDTETPSQQTVGLGKRLIRKEHGKFYTYVSRPEYEEFQEELDKQKEIEKIHRRIE